METPLIYARRPPPGDLRPRLAFRLARPDLRFEIGQVGRRGLFEPGRERRQPGVLRVLLQSVPQLPWRGSVRPPELLHGPEGELPAGHRPGLLEVLLQVDEVELFVLEGLGFVLGFVVVLGPRELAALP